MTPKTLVFTGAPAPSSLEWDSAILLESFTVPVARFAKLSPSPNEVTNTSFDVDSTCAAWRSLDIDRQHLPTGHSQVHAWVKDYQGNADFFTVSKLSLASFSSDLDIFQLRDGSVSSSESMQEVLSQFYEHSFALHTTATPPQAAISPLKEGLARPESNSGTSFTSMGTSFASDTDSLSVDSLSNLSPILPAIPVGGNIMDLRDIPNASFLDSIQPQTMTINIIVGIISVVPPRAIKTRRGAEVELVELLVGDETRSGFGINFWLSVHPKSNHAEHGVEDMRNDLAALRPQDIVLLRNVALSSFRGKVYGQSLRKELTKLNLLYRNRVDKNDVRGHYKVDDLDKVKEPHSQLTKTMNVKDWVFRFVAPGVTRGLGKGDTKAVMESLPLDTQ